MLDGRGTEKEAPQNKVLRAFDVIDRIKRVLEIRCPGVVSYADILNLAARDATGLAGEPKYPVFTGRRDGLRSNAKLVDMPSPSVSWNKALDYFKSRGLNVLDLGTLLGTAGAVGYQFFPYIVDTLLQRSISLLHVKDPLFKRMGASRLSRFAVDDVFNNFKDGEGRFRVSLCNDIQSIVFLAFGNVQKIAMFEKNGGMQSLIQYPGLKIQSLKKFRRVKGKKLLC